MIPDFENIMKKLTDIQILLLHEMATALQSNINEWVNPNSDLANSNFAESISNRLRLHHANSPEKFSKESFEYAFLAANKFAGRKGTKTISNTHAGADVIIENTRWSLKTEGAAKISQSILTISKFSEARWIRNCATQEDFSRETTTRIKRHLDEYDRIITLRSFYIDNNTVRYDLVEIPKTLLLAVEKLIADDFSLRTEAGSSSATIRIDASTSFTVVLDGSVEKITIKKIPMSSCILHARWEIPIMPLSIGNKI